MGKLSIIARAGITLAGVAALVGGATFATLGDTATLSENTIATESAALTVSLDGACETGFTDEVTGFNFAGIVPGATDSTNAAHFCLKNEGTINEDVMLTVPQMPTFSDSNNVPVVVNANKVHVNVTCTGDGPATFTDTLQNIWFNGSSFQLAMPANGVADCSAKVSMEADAFTADSVHSNTFDLVFSSKLSPVI